MKRIVSVLIRPLATRIAALASAGLSGAMVVDPAMSARLEAWVLAGVLLLADLLIVNIKKQEVR